MRAVRDRAPVITAERRRLLIESAALYGSIHVSLFCHFLAGFLVAKLLGPSLYGLRSIFGLVEQYESVATLGTFNAMEREVPYYRGREDHAAADRISQSVWTANFVYAAVAGALLVAASFLMRGVGIAPIYADFVVFLAGYVLLGRAEQYYQAQLIIDKQTRAVGGLRLVQGGVAAIASVSLVLVAGLRGLFLGILIGKVATIVYAALRAPAPPGLGASWPIVRRMIVIGFPIMSIKFLFILFQTVDKLLIAIFLPREMLGYFAVAAILSGVIFMTLADAVKVLFSARMMETLGEDRHAGSLGDYFTAPTILIAWLAPVAVGALVLIVHLPFEHFLPEYLPAVPVARVLIMGQYFFAVVTVAILACVALDRQNTLAMLTAGGILLNATGNVLLLSAGFTIRAVAVWTGASYLVFAIVLLVFTTSLLRSSGATVPMRTVATVMAPWLICLLLVASVDRVIPVGGLDLAHDLGRSALRVGVYLGLYGIVLRLLRSHPAFAVVVERIRGTAAVVG